jgi:hypothetical protein
MSLASKARKRRRHVIRAQNGGRNCRTSQHAAAPVAISIRCHCGTKIKVKIGTSPTPDHIDPNTQNRCSQVNKRQHISRKHQR